MKTFINKKENLNNKTLDCDRNEFSNTAVFFICIARIRGELKPINNLYTPF